MKSPESKPAVLSLLAMMPKSDKVQEKNQDSAHYNAACGRFAVADGVSRMLFSELFSRSLTRRFCDAGEATSRDLFESKDWRAFLQPSCQVWHEETPLQIAAAQGLAQMTLNNRWNAGQLGGATFAGIEIKTTAQGTHVWRAMIIGDCCLIQLDDKGRWLASHLIQSSDEFDSRPRMFVSGKEDDLPAPAFIQGHAARGDSFIFASDTMAKWLMQQHESGNWASAYTWLTTLNDAQSFAERIDRLRSEPPVVMDDDDMTLMLVQVAPARSVMPRILMPTSVPALEGAAAAPVLDVPMPQPDSGWKSRWRGIANDGWAATRPHLTRQRVLPAVAIVLVLAAILLAIITTSPQVNSGVTSSPLQLPAATSTPYIARNVLFGTSSPTLQP